MEKAIPKSRLHIREKCDIEQIMNNKAILSGSLPSLSRGMWQQYQPAKQQALLPMGVPWVDARLHGGIARHALHEFFGAAKADVTAAAAFALLLALRLPEPQLRIFWISGDKERRASGRLYPPGLAEMGGDPARMLLVQAADLRDALRAAADSIRSKAAGAVILEAQGNARLIDLTSTRRLALAAAEAGVLALLVRGDAVPMPSAATTRWQVRSAPAAFARQCPRVCDIRHQPAASSRRHRAFRGESGLESCNTKLSRRAAIWRSFCRCYRRKD
jgi:protein ImuA